MHLSTAFPIWVLVVDYALGLVMWTLIGRTAMNLFQSENSDFFFMKAFVRLTNPLLRLWKPITPQFLLPALVPLLDEKTLNAKQCEMVAGCAVAKCVSPRTPSDSLSVHHGRSTL